MRTISKLFIPAILVIVGFSIIFNETIKSKIASKVKEDKISEAGAIQRLGDVYFEKIEIMANAEFSKDDHNNVKVSYEQEKEVNRAVRNGELRPEADEEMER